MTRSALLISTYEMGRQPFGLASAAAWLGSDGWTVRSIDAAKEKLTEVRNSKGPAERASSKSDLGALR